MTPIPASLRDIARDLKISIQFCTRLPLGPTLDVRGAEIARTAWALPVAGALVGLIGALAYSVSHAVGVPPWPAAALALAATAIATGCLHEDGLADTADGFGGGGTRERKLEIMRDSRIGTYGTCALMLSILIKAGAIASLATPAQVTASLIAAHAAGRASMPILMWLVPAARTDGLSADAAGVSSGSAMMAAAIGLAVAALAMSGMDALLIGLCLLLAIGGMARLSIKQIGGQTGDVLGAIEQVGEIIVLLVAAVRH